MKKAFYYLLGLCAIAACYWFVATKLDLPLTLTHKTDSLSSIQKKIQNGDLIFHTSRSAQSKAIQLATHSRYSHCGILYKVNDSWMVFEAVQPVKLTPLAKWINRGKDQKYVVKRLKNHNLLSASVLSKIKKEGNEFMGKAYDITFEWSDEKIYCCELIWKIYKRALGIELGQLQTLNEFDLSNNQVQQIMRKRYGNHIPLQEKVISPERIYNSNLLTTVVSTY